MAQTNLRGRQTVQGGVRQAPRPLVDRRIRDGGTGRSWIRLPASLKVWGRVRGSLLSCPQDRSIFEQVKTVMMIDTIHMKYKLQIAKTLIGQYQYCDGYTKIKQQMSGYNHEMQKIGTYISKYRIEYLIAAGTFGKVYLASYSLKKYAIKEMLEPTKPLPKHQMENQIQVLADLRHDNIVKLYEVVRDKGNVYLVMEYCQSDMRELISAKNGGFEEQEAHGILTQIVTGMSELVKLHIVHRDIKPANILYSKGTFKIADFGLAKYTQDQSQMLKTRVGTPFYMAPQILKNERYTSKCDIWSLGIIFYQLLFGRLPWYATSEEDLIYNIYHTPLVIPTNVLPRTRRLIEKMIAIEEYQRFTWQELVKELAKDHSGLFEMEKSFHKTTMEKLVQLELNRVSIASYGRKFETLKQEQKKSVAGLVIRFFNEENKDLCSFFVRAKFKN